MKTNLKQIIFLTIVLTFILLNTTSAITISGQEIMDKAEENMNYGNYNGKAEMIIFTSSGDERVLKMEIWGQGTDKSIMKYYNPRRVSGVTFLFLNDDIWSYFPRTGRVRHLGAHVKNQEMMGSSFSYDDFSGDVFDDYQSKLIKEEEELAGEKCYLVEGIAKNKEAGYDSFTAWVTKDGFRPLQVYYFQDKQKVKIMTCETFHKVNGQLRPKKIVMKDLRDDDKTIFEYLEIKTGVKFAPDFFHERNLKRISQR